VSALGKVVRAGVGRRRVQTVVTVLTTLLAVASAVLAAGLLVASESPFDTAFGQQRGAHLSAQFDGRAVTAAQLAGTAHATGVTASAGPFPVVEVHPHGTAQHMSNVPLPQLTVVGRASAGGSVDRVELTEGHWATKPGEIVVAVGNLGPFSRPGSTLTFPDLPGTPTLTVVGTARSVSRTADAWVTPAQARALAPAGSTPGYEMLYRFRQAATSAQVTADKAAITGAVPAHALTGAQSYLTVRQEATREIATFVPFVVAFGVLGLLLSVLIIGVVVSGAVGAATRRIGILKSLGFTPAQVVRGYVGQALIPAAVGTVLGVVVGNLLAVPVLSQAADSYGTGSLVLAPWIDVAVPAGALAVVALTALVPALRAGRLRTVEAVSVGRTPRATRGRLVRRLAGRLPLPRPVTLGLANPATRPARAATVAASVAFGAAAVTFAVGLTLSLNGIDADLNRDQAGAVTAVAAPPPGAAMTQGDPAAVAAAIADQPGTRRYFSLTRAQVAVVGLAGSVDVVAYQGDSSWASLRIISGRWFQRPDEIVVPTAFLRTTDTRVGDSVTLTDGNRSQRVRIVGEALDLHNEGRELLTDSRTLAGLPAATGDATGTKNGGEGGGAPAMFQVDLKPGTNLGGYLDKLNAALKPAGGSATANTAETSGTVLAMDSMVFTLTLLLLAVAGLAVLNTVVLDTRERVHDLGVCKALGMTPRQTVAMVLTSVGGTGLLAGLVGMPFGVLLHHWVLPMMGQAAGTGLPRDVMDVFHPALLVPLALGGLVIAVVGALLPAGWASRTRVTTALRTE
jgi:putative ABC transport system permease protein